MDAWDLYGARIRQDGLTKRDTTFRREMAALHTKLPDSLSYHCVAIDGMRQDVAIINSDNLNEKTMFSLVKNNASRVRGGELVDWMQNYWLVVECDANHELYTRSKIKQCNYLLRWVDTDGVLHEQWCVVEDGTKLRMLVSAQRNLCVKISIELLETPKAHITTA